MSHLLYNGPGFQTLHNTYAKKGYIDNKAQIVASSDAIIKASQSKVWQALIDIAAYPSFDSDFSDVNVGNIKVDAPLSFKIKGFPIHAVIAVVSPGEELTWTGRSLWTKAVDRHIIEVIDDAHTRLRIEESLAGAFVPWMFTSKQLDRQHRAWLEGMKHKLEVAEVS